MVRKDEYALVKAELIDGLRSRVAYELRSSKRRVLNDVEADALARLEAVALSGGDYHATARELLGAPLDIRASLA